MALTTVDQGLLGQYAQYTGFKNRIINGAMGIWQRGTSFGSTFGIYTADRWAAGNQTTVTQNTDVPSTAYPYSIDIAVSSASYPYVFQRIESNNCQDLASQQVTVSFWAKNVSGSAWLYIELYYPTAKDNYTSVTLIQSIVLTQNPSSSWTYYTATFNALPSNAVNGLELRIIRNNVSAAETRITGVQLEKGSTATSFDYRPYGTELSLCQRYYQLAGGTGRSLATNTIDCYAVFQTEMRATPSTPTAVNTSNTAVQFGRALTSITAVVNFFMASTRGAGLAVTVTDTGLTTNVPAAISSNALAFNAEL